MLMPAMLRLYSTADASSAIWDLLCTEKQAPVAWTPPERVPQWIAPPMPTLANSTAQLALGRWIDDGIQLEDVRRASRANGEHCVSVRIINNHVYAKGGANVVQRAQKWFLNDRYNELLTHMEIAAGAGDSPLRENVELVYCAGDCVLAMDASDDEVKAHCPKHPKVAAADLQGSPLPTWTPVACLGSRSIAVPMFYRRPSTPDVDTSLTRWPTTQTKLQSWPRPDAQSDKILFAGRAGTSCWTGEPNAPLNRTSAECGRLKLMSVLAKENPDMFTVAQKVTYLEFNRWRYSLVVEGNCGWADRTKIQLHLKSALFIQQSFCQVPGARDCAAGGGGERGGPVM